MTEPKFLLELLVRLFTDPPGFYRGGQRPDGGIGRQVQHIVFLLTCRPPLADGTPRVLVPPRPRRFCSERLPWSAIKAATLTLSHHALVTVQHAPPRDYILDLNQ